MQFDMAVTQENIYEWKEYRFDTFYECCIFHLRFTYVCLYKKCFCICPWLLFQNINQNEKAHIYISK